MCLTEGAAKRMIIGRRGERHAEERMAVPSSGLIDLAIGMVFVFGVTAALASVFTEAAARLVGLRGAYLLVGLRELVDNGVDRRPA
jgi:hypothetical protein